MPFTTWKHTETETSVYYDFMRVGDSSTEYSAQPPKAGNSFHRYYLKDLSPIFACICDFSTKFDF